MPRPLTKSEHQKRLRAWLHAQDWDHQEVDNLVEKALASALREFRSNGERPAWLKAEQAAEHVFEAGFLAAAVAFWDDILYSRERQRSAQKGSRSATSRRRVKPGLIEQVRAEATIYRRAHAYSRQHSTRAMAQHVARRLKLSPSTVRAILYQIGIP